MSDRAASFLPIARLQTKDGICAYLGDISHATYDAWQAKGKMPGPVPGTTRYDIRAHDLALDRLGGLAAAAQRGAHSPLEDWEAGNHAA
jgi:hypothetical protein